MQGDFCDKSNLIATKTSSCVNLSKTAPLKLRISTSKSINVAHKLKKSTYPKSKSYNKTQENEAPILWKRIGTPLIIFHVINI